MTTHGHPPSSAIAYLHVGMNAYPVHRVADQNLQRKKSCHFCDSVLLQESWQLQSDGSSQVQENFCKHAKKIAGSLNTTLSKKFYGFFSCQGGACEKFPHPGGGYTYLQCLVSHFNKLLFGNILGCTPFQYLTTLPVPPSTQYFY